MVFYMRTVTIVACLVVAVVVFRPIPVQAQSPASLAGRITALETSFPLCTSRPDARAWASQIDTRRQSSAPKSCQLERGSTASSPKARTTT